MSFLPFPGEGDRNLLLWQAIFPDVEWHEVGDARTGLGTTFANAWVNVGGAYATAAFRLVLPGLLALKGTVTSGGNNAAVFTLPPGYRPAKERRIPAVVVDNGSQSYPGQLTVYTTGLVSPYSSSGVVWPVEQFSLEGLVAL